MAVYRYLVHLLCECMRNIPYYHIISVENLKFCCSYEASAQDVENGILRMHRNIMSAHVQSFAPHVPTEEVELEKEEDIIFKKGVLTHASGSTSVKLLRKVCQCTYYV